MCNLVSFKSLYVYIHVYILTSADGECQIKHLNTFKTLPTFIELLVKLTPWNKTYIGAEALINRI